METYDEIYTRMKEKYEEESGSEVDNSSDVAIRLRVLAGEIYNAECNLDWLKRQMYAESASGERLDYIAAQRGLTRKAAAKATGSLIFSVNETVDYPITIPAGTVAATNGETPIRVYTTETAVLPQATYSVTVPAEAELAGYNGNIAGGTADVPVSVPVGIDSVTNAVFRGGADEESDETLRRRIKDSYNNRPNAANAAFFKQLAETVDGIDKAGTIARFNGIGTLGVFVARNDYDVTDEALSSATALLEENKTIGSYVEVRRATHVDYDLNVSVTAKAGYEAAEVEQMLTDAFTDYITSVPVGGKIYLSILGKYLFDTGCIENYEFDYSMQNSTLSGSQFFRAGDITIEVN